VADKAMHRSLKPANVGSIPTGPTRKDKHWSFRGKDSALVMRMRRFESGPVLCWFFDNLVVMKRAHDVVAACCLARADVPVQLRLGALFQDEGKSGVCPLKTRRVPWEHEIAGSNPAVLTVIPEWPNGEALAC
jgi:hypothetical protein